MNKFYDFNRNFNAEHLKAIIREFKWKAMRLNILREIQTFKVQNEKPHVQNEEQRRWLDFVNGGVYSRHFSRLCVLAGMDNTWLTLQDIVTTLGANDKTARLNFQKARDVDMLDICKEKQTSNSVLKFKGNEKIVAFYERYFDLVFDSETALFAEALNTNYIIKELKESLVTITKQNAQ
tara:strand:+ start:6164 stop:6700 length:537 start_codon:yes stop_codon:yes gene_type:complete